MCLPDVCIQVYQSLTRDGWDSDDDDDNDVKIDGH